MVAVVDGMLLPEPPPVELVLEDEVPLNCRPDDDYDVIWWGWWWGVENVPVSYAGIWYSNF